MTYQTGRQIAISLNEETTYGVPADKAGAKVLRFNTGGLNLGIETIRSNENRRDGQTTRGRHGSRSVTGQFSVDLSVGTYDDLTNAVFRGAPLPSLDIDESDMASATVAVGAHTITASAGSWITAGLRVGDVIRLKTGFAAGNMGRNIRVTGLTATVITVAETLSVQAGPIAAYTITRPKKVIQGQVKRSFSVEEGELDIGASELSTGVRWGQMQIKLDPNGMCIVTYSAVGQDQKLIEAPDYPYFEDPAETVSIGLTAVEARLRLGDEDIADVSSAELSINLNAGGEPVVGSNLTPDVFLNNAVMEGSISFLKKDVTRVRQYLNEEALSLHLLFEEQTTGGGAPGFCSFFVGNFTFGAASKSDAGSDGPRKQTFQLNIGKDLRGGAYDPTMIAFQTSAA